MSVGEWPESIMTQWIHWVHQLEMLLKSEASAGRLHNVYRFIRLMRARALSGLMALSGTMLALR
jgi:hypothetical protein